MSSAKQNNYLYLIKFITTYNYTSSSIYKYCSTSLTIYIIITDSSKCSKYTHYSHSYIKVSLKSLNCTYLWLKSKFKVTLNEHAVQEKMLKK